MFTPEWSVFPERNTSFDKRIVNLHTTAYTNHQLPFLRTLFEPAKHLLVLE